MSCSSRPTAGILSGPWSSAGRRAFGRAMDETEPPAQEKPREPAAEAVGQAPGAETSPEAKAPESVAAAAEEDAGASLALTPALSRGEREGDAGVSPALTAVGRSLRETRPSVAADAGTSGGRPPVPPLSRGEREEGTPPEEPAKPARRRGSLAERLREPEEVPIEVPLSKARARTRRDF